MLVEKSRTARVNASYTQDLSGIKDGHEEANLYQESIVEDDRAPLEEGYDRRSKSRKGVLQQMRDGLPNDVDSYVLWILTPISLLVLDVFLLFLKLFFLYVEDFLKTDTWVGSFIIIGAFVLKLGIPPFFMCSRTRQQLYYMNFCYVVRIVYDVLVIVPLCVFMVLIDYVHWAVLVIVPVMLLFANLCTCCLCIWDSYRFIDKYDLVKDEQSRTKTKTGRTKQRRVMHDDSEDLAQYGKAPDKLESI